jgi:F-type H+-transporting ATPase subunit epsilon
MERPDMHLKILLPFGIAADMTDVLRIVAETRSGSFGILPRRRDCVASLTPGILVFETRADGEAYAAVDEGVLTKTGGLVLVAVRNAILGAGLPELRRAVEAEFLQLNEQERGMRRTLAKIESGFIRRMARFHHER